MALAVLKLDEQHRFMATSPIVRQARWRTVRDAGNVAAVVSEAVATASARAQAQVREQARREVLQRESQAQRELMAKVLALQAEYDRLRSQLFQQFVQTQTTCLEALLAGPLPAAYFERIAQSAQHWLGERAPFVLHVAAADEAQARHAVDELVARLHAQERMALLVDPDLEAGQAYVQTDFGRLQAGLMVQLEALSQALQSWWRQGSSVPVGTSR